MIDFLLCILQYVIIAVILLAIGCLGAFVGHKLRNLKDGKKAKADQPAE